MVIATILPLARVSPGPIKYHNNYYISTNEVPQCCDIVISKISHITIHGTG